MTDERTELRRTLRAGRTAFVEALPPSVRAIAFRALPSPVRARLPAGGCVALYAPVGSEAPTRHIAAQLAEAGHPLALPWFADRAVPMAFAAWLPDEALVPGPFGAQPAGEGTIEPSALIVPMLGFDAAMGRLGQGGGHYDRALAALPGALRIGLAWSAQEVDRVPTEEWDMPMDVIVTEQRFLEREDAA